MIERLAALPRRGDGDVQLFADAILADVVIEPARPEAFVLRILVVLNWLLGAAILALLVVMPNEQWIMQAFKLTPSRETDRIIVAKNASPLVIGLGEGATYCGSDIPAVLPHTRRVIVIVRVGLASGRSTRPEIRTLPPATRTDRTTMRRWSLSRSERSLPTRAW